MNITLDIILLAVLVISFVIGYKKGFVKSVWKIVALVVTIVLVLALKTPTVNFLAGSDLANNISTKIAENVNIPQGGGVDIVTLAGAVVRADDAEVIRHISACPVEAADAAPTMRLIR